MPSLSPETSSALRRNAILMAVLAALSAALFAIPRPAAVGFMQEGRLCRAEVLSADDSQLMDHGVTKYGSQLLRVRILDGAAKGREYAACNELRAQLELDKIFRPGDIALVVMPQDSAELPPEDAMLTAQQRYRAGWGWCLFGAFCVLLCIFGGWTGFKALLSFVFSCIVIWRAVIPLALAGYPASWVSFAAVVLLTAVIMYLVAGATRRCAVATAGAAAGVLAGLLMAHFFARIMAINGATMPYAQTLLYSGFEGLDLQDIFIGAMMLASSGAVMDLAMDIACGLEEVSRHNPTLGRSALLASGLRMGRSVVGTMTTTLLLAYSGGYITLLMMFSAQGNRPADFINNPLVAAEAVKTLIGSFSLVLVAPFTALIGAIAFARRAK